MTPSPSPAALRAARVVYPKAVSIGTHLALFGDPDDPETDAAREQAIVGLAGIIDAELATERQGYIAALEGARVLVKDAADRITAALS